MDSLDATQIPNERTFWNSHEPSLDSFDDTVVPTMAIDPLEACNSTFQQFFPSTGSTCDNSDDHQAMFKVVNTTSHQTNIFVAEGGAEDQSSQLAAAQSIFCTNVHDAAAESAPQFTWTLPSSPPPYHPEAVELGASDAKLLVGHFGGGALDPDFFRVPLSSHGLEVAHGAENQVPSLIEVPHISQPSLPQMGGIKEHTTSKGSWQAQGAPENQYSIKDQPLGSQSSVISGFSKAGDPVGSDSNMATSFAGTSSSHGAHGHEGNLESPVTAAQVMSETQVGCRGGTKKRKRSKPQKQSIPVEISQRMTHIAVERNRRKQMNEHLAVLRALMPGSYVLKGDQASIVGGTIEFVKELENLLVCLQAQKRRRELTSRLAMPSPDPQHAHINVQPPLSFQSPQSAIVATSADVQRQNFAAAAMGMGIGMGMVGMVGEAKTEAANVEVRMESAERARVKVMAVRRSGLLLRSVVALESMPLSVLHANITTVNHSVQYTFQVHVAPHCRLSPHQMAQALALTFLHL